MLFLNKEVHHSSTLLPPAVVNLKTSPKATVSTEKSKIMTNSTNNITADISMNSQKLEEVTSFRYLEPV